MLSVAEVVNLGYKIASVSQLKPKHIIALVKYWQAKGLSNGSITNRLAAIRHFAILTNKRDLVASNKKLGIGPRNYTATKNKAITKSAKPQKLLAFQMQLYYF